MKQLSLSLIALIAFCCLHLTTTAQHDSTWLDAGVVKIRSDFTQTITVKGADLEKMPYTNLSDAIAAWLYGAYSSRSALTYVVDGNYLSDVNMYSVYDIEEIVYVPSAVVQLNTGVTQQQVVLITTRKKGAGKAGITLAAQLNTITRDFKNEA